MLATVVWLACPQMPPQLLQFVAEHGNIAAAMLRGDGFADTFGTPSGPTAWTPPVFPCYLAIVFLVFGTKTLAAAWAMIFLDAAFAAVCVLCTLAILDLSGRPALKPWLALVLVALTWLHEAALGPWLSTGWFVAALAAAFLMAAVGAMETGRKSWWWLLALTGGALILTHAGCGLAAIVVVIALWLAAAHRAMRLGKITRWEALRAASARPLLVLSFCAAVIAGWTGRNWAIFHQLIPLKSAGWFEIYLAEKYTKDGVLDDAVMVAHHPFSNPRLLVDYTTEGEAVFLAGYRDKAKQILAAAPGVFVRHIGGRALSVFSYCDTAPHAYLCRVDLSHEDGVKLVDADLAARYTRPLPVVWTCLDLSPVQFERRLHESGVAEIRPLVEDWRNAKEAMLAGESRPIRVLSSIALAGLPAACMLGTLAFRRRKIDFSFTLCALFYIFAVLPNVLITHYASHQLHFLGLHAFFIVSFGASIFRSRRTAP
jgi:hypothetical protein